MNGTDLLLDTNIFIYYFQGELSLISIFKEYRIHLSIITEIELLSFHKIKTTEIKLIQGLLSETKIIGLDQGIKEKAIETRKKFNLKLPDSIILATSQQLKIPLFTADKKIQAIGEFDIISFSV
jgi:hypothetical protein